MASIFFGTRGTLLCPNVKIMVRPGQRNKYHEDDAMSGVSDTVRPYSIHCVFFRITLI